MRVPLSAVLTLAMVAASFAVQLAWADARSDYAMMLSIWSNATVSAKDPLPSTCASWMSDPFEIDGHAFEVSIGLTSTQVVTIFADKFDGAFPPTGINRTYYINLLTSQEAPPEPSKRKAALLKLRQRQLLQLPPDEPPPQQNDPDAEVPMYMREVAAKITLTSTNSDCLLFTSSTASTLPPEDPPFNGDPIFEKVAELKTFAEMNLTALVPLNPLPATCPIWIGSLFDMNEEIRVQAEANVSANVDLFAAWYGSEFPPENPLNKTIYLNFIATNGAGLGPQEVDHLNQIVYSMSTTVQIRKVIAQYADTCFEAPLGPETPTPDPWGVPTINNNTDDPDLRILQEIDIEYGAIYPAEGVNNASCPVWARTGEALSQHIAEMVLGMTDAAAITDFGAMFGSRFPPPGFNTTYYIAYYEANKGDPGPAPPPPEGGTTTTTNTSGFDEKFVMEQKRGLIQRIVAAVQVKAQVGNCVNISAELPPASDDPSWDPSWDPSSDPFGNITDPDLIILTGLIQNFTVGPKVTNNTGCPAWSTNPEDFEAQEQSVLANMTMESVILAFAAQFGSYFPNASFNATFYIDYYNTHNDSFSGGMEPPGAGSGGMEPPMGPPGPGGMPPMPPMPPGGEGGGSMPGGDMSGMEEMMIMMMKRGVIEKLVVGQVLLREFPNCVQRYQTFAPPNGAWWDPNDMYGSGFVIQEIYHNTTMELVVPPGPTCPSFFAGGQSTAEPAFVAQLKAMDPTAAVATFAQQYGPHFGPSGLNVSMYNRAITEFNLTASSTATVDASAVPTNGLEEAMLHFQASISYMKQVLLKQQWLATYPTCVTVGLPPLPPATSSGSTTALTTRAPTTTAPGGQTATTAVTSTAGGTSTATSTQTGTTGAASTTSAPTTSTAVQTGTSSSATPTGTPTATATSPPANASTSASASSSATSTATATNPPNVTGQTTPPPPPPPTTTMTPTPTTTNTMAPPPPPETTVAQVMIFTATWPPNTPIAATDIASIKGYLSTRTGAPATSFAVTVRNMTNGTVVVSITPTGADAGRSSQIMEQLTEQDWIAMGFTGKASAAAAAAPEAPPSGGDDDNKRYILIAAVVGTVLVVGLVALVVRQKLRSNKLTDDSYVDQNGVLQDPTATRLGSDVSYEMYSNRETSARI